jgi:type IV pilus assembly protein PilC
MIFNFKATTKEGNKEQGVLDAPSLDLAIASLQRRGLLILDIKSADEETFLERTLSIGSGVKMKQIVFLSRQISTMFEAKVSALSTFRLLAAEAETPRLRKILTTVTDDLNSGVLISAALAKHPTVFSDFYVNMVRAGEESGKISESFNYLAAYLERSNELVSKARNALIYPAFVIGSFVIVMILMMVYVIPKLSAILKDTGQEIPIYTKIVLAASDFMVNYGIILLFIFLAACFFLYRYLRTESGQLNLAHFKLTVPVIKILYQKLYLSRIADNLSTMLTSGIPMVRALDITADVVGNDVYKNILRETSNGVKTGSAISAILYKHPEIPSIMIQMIKVGEETGKLGFILETLSRFYTREVYNAVDTIVDLIEPAMIVFLGLGVGVLLTSVLVPIYNVASGV